MIARDAHLSVRVPADLKDKLQRLADADQRSLATYIMRALQEHVAQIEKNSKPRKS
jgi:predicted transcriptional regulator